MIHPTSKKRKLNPFLDRILSNPLSFIQSNKRETDDVDTSKFVVLTKKKPSIEAAKPEPKEVATSKKKKPKSMAEAVAAYTGKKYGVAPKKRNFDLVDSEEEDLGEELEPSQQSQANENVEKKETKPEMDSSSDYESANEYQSSEDSDYKLQSTSGSESRESEEPEDLQLLKEDLKSEATKAEKESSTPPTSPDDIPDISQDLYQFNELPIDRGSNRSTRINKSWDKNFMTRKPIGLLNHGVTCYMNTAVQSLIHIPALQNYLNEIVKGAHNSRLKNRSVSHVLAELSQRLWNLDDSNKQFIHPKKIINRLEDINCMMSEWQQEDSHEYLMSLISRLQEDSTPKGEKLNSSIIYDIFGGALNQVVVCQNCHNQSTTQQEFYDLSLGFNKKRKSGDESGSKYSIQNSIEDFFSSELIKNDKSNGYYCDKCKQHTNATKISTIDVSPETLIVHLKRFKFNGRKSLKVKQSIKYSNYINLTEFSTKKTPTFYQLVSIISHEGRSIASGHYISHCLQPDQSWSTYDDEYINKINQFQALNDPSAYVLIYSKLTPK